jgi:hypothetical protein
MRGRGQEGEKTAFMRRTGLLSGLGNQHTG